MTLKISQHAKVRVRQRGLRENDLNLIVQVGTAIDVDSVFLLDRDVEREVRKRKREIVSFGTIAWLSGSSRWRDRRDRL